MMIIMIVTFDGSVVCQALIVSHILSHLIPTLSTRSLNQGPGTLGILLSLIPLEVVTSEFEPGRYGSSICMLNH